MYSIHFILLSSHSHPSPTPSILTSHLSPLTSTDKDHHITTTQHKPMHASYSRPSLAQKGTTKKNSTRAKRPRPYATKAQARSQSTSTTHKARAVEEESQSEQTSGLLASSPAKDAVHEEQKTNASRQKKPSLWVSERSRKQPPVFCSCAVWWCVNVEMYLVIQMPKEDVCLCVCGAS